MVERQTGSKQAQRVSGEEEADLGWVVRGGGREQGMDLLQDRGQGGDGGLALDLEAGVQHGVDVVRRAAHQVLGLHRQHPLYYLHHRRTRFWLCAQADGLSCGQRARLVWLDL